MSSFSSVAQSLVKRLVSKVTVFRCFNVTAVGAAVSAGSRMFLSLGRGFMLQITDR